MQRLVFALASLLLIGATCSNLTMIEQMPSQEQCLEGWNNQANSDYRPSMAEPVDRVDVTPFAYWLGEIPVYQCAFDFYAADGQRTSRSLAEGTFSPNSPQFRMRLIDPEVIAVSLAELDTGNADLIGPTLSYPFDGTSIGQPTGQP